MTKLNTTITIVILMISSIGLELSYRTYIELQKQKVLYEKISQNCSDVSILSDFISNILEHQENKNRNIINVYQYLKSKSSPLKIEDIEALIEEADRQDIAYSLPISIMGAESGFGTKGLPVSSKSYNIFCIGDDSNGKHRAYQSYKSAIVDFYEVLNSKDTYNLEQICLWYPHKDKAGINGDWYKNAIKIKDEFENYIK